MASSYSHKHTNSNINQPTDRPHVRRTKIIIKQKNITDTSKTKSNEYKIMKKEENMRSCRAKLFKL